LRASHAAVALEEDDRGMNARRITLGAAVLAVASLLGGCAVYPAYPAYTSYPSAPVVYSGSTTTVAPAPVAPVVVAPAPVYVAPPPPVYYGPAFYPSISLGFFGRFGGHHHHGHHRHHRHHGHRR
jgi:hypothetical protein